MYFNCKFQKIGRKQVSYSPNVSAPVAVLVLIGCDLTRYKGSSDWPKRPEAWWEMTRLRTPRNAEVKTCFGRLRRVSDIIENKAAVLDSERNMTWNLKYPPGKQALCSYMCCAIVWKTHWALTLVMLIPFEPMCHQTFFMFALQFKCISQVSTQTNCYFQWETWKIRRLGIFFGPHGLICDCVVHH